MDIKADNLYREMQSMLGDAKALQGDLPTMPPNLEIGSNSLEQVNASKAEFAQMLSNAVNQVNDMQLESKGMQRAFEMGDSSLSLADVMVAKEKASIAFEATVQVRNKVLDAYKQIMNMPV